MNIKGFFLWCINDIISYAKDKNQNEDDIDFLETDKKALRIIKRYNIK